MSLAPPAPRLSSQRRFPACLLALDAALGFIEKMILAIQPEETVRSFMEKLLAQMQGGISCYGLNKMLNRHTNYPLKEVFKSVQDVSYYRVEYIGHSRCYDLNRTPTGFVLFVLPKILNAKDFPSGDVLTVVRLKVCADHGKSCFEVASANQPLSGMSQQLLA